MTFISALLLLATCAGTYLTCIPSWPPFVFSVEVVLGGCGLWAILLCELLVQFVSLHVFTGFFASLKLYSYDCYRVH